MIGVASRGALARTVIAITIASALVVVGSGGQAAASAALELVSQELALPVNTPLTIGFSSPAEIPEDAVAVITVYRKVTARGELTNVLNRTDVVGSLPAAIDSVDIPVSSLSRDGSTYLLTVATESEQRTAEALQFPSAGLFPVVIDVRSGSMIIGDLRTVVDRQPNPDVALLPALQASVVGSLTTPPALPGTSSSLPEAVNEAVAQLAAADPLLNMTVAISPELLSRLTPNQHDGLQSALQGIDLISQPYRPFDASQAAAAGQQSRFTQLLVDGETFTAATLQTSPTIRSVWIEPGSLGTRGAEMLRDLGVRLAVITPQAFNDSINRPVFADTMRIVLASLADGSLPIAVIDVRATDVLESTIGSFEQRAIYAAADLLVTRNELHNGGDLAGHTLFIGRSDGGLPDIALLNRVAGLLQPTGAVTFLPLVEAFDQTSRLIVDGFPLSVVLPEVDGTELATKVEDAAQTRQALVATASMLGDDDPVSERWFATLEALDSSSTPLASTRAALAALEAESAEIRSHVVTPQEFSFTVSGRETAIPIVLQSNAERPLDVKVRLTSSKMTFPEGDMAVTLLPEVPNEVKIPVFIRSNGTFNVTLSVLTPQPDGSGREILLGEPVTLTANVRTLSGLAQVLTGGFVLMVLAWWYKNSRNAAPSPGGG